MECPNFTALSGNVWSQCVFTRAQTVISNAGAIPLMYETQSGSKHAVTLCLPASLETGHTMAASLLQWDEENREDRTVYGVYIDLNLTQVGWG